MKLLNYFLIFTLSFLIYSCDSTDPKPPDTKPPGYQEDIPWPSLADSPWPSEHSTMQNSMRSKYAGPIAGSVVFENPVTYIQTGAVIDSDNNLYYLDSDGLCKYSSTGERTVLYSISIYSGWGTVPLLTKDEKIIFAALTTSQLICVDKTGNLIWEKKEIKMSHSRLTITKHGIILLYNFNNDENRFQGYNLNGEKVIDVNSDNLFYGQAASFSISPDGNTVYGMSSDLCNILAFDLTTQKEKWRSEPSIYPAFHPPLVDAQGNLYEYYFKDRDNASIISYTAAGDKRWEVKLDSIGLGFSSKFPLSIDKEGNVCSGLTDLYCINREGEVVWKREYRSNQTKRMEINSPITIDKNNNLFYTILDPDNGLKYFISLTSDNKVNYSIPIVYNGIIDYTLCMDSQNSIYILPYHGDIITKVN